MISKTEAIVLRSMKYRETSRILTFYTKAFGKIGGIVKGARSSKNTFGASLQPMAHVGIVLYKKEGKDLHAVTQCELIKAFRGLSEELPRMASGMAIIELVSNIAHEEEENPELFDALLDSLTQANTAGTDPMEALFRFQVRLAGILGFKPVFDQCISCGKGVPDTKAMVGFELERGGPLCSKCQTPSSQLFRISGNILHYLGSLDGTTRPAGEKGTNFGAPIRHEIEKFLEAFFRQHVSGIRALKTDRVFSRLISDP